MFSYVRDRAAAAMEEEVAALRAAEREIMAAQPPTPARAPGADTVRLPRGCIPGLGQPDEEQVTTSTATDWSVVREGVPGRGGLQGTRPRAGQLGGPASRGLVRKQSTGESNPLEIDTPAS